MATPKEKLANALKVLQKFQNADGIAVVKSSEMPRTHIRVLLNSGFLREVIRGWYISSMPGEVPGDTTSWYASYWHFIAAYANSRFKNKWSLTADQSLRFHSGNKVVPSQILIRTSKAASNPVALPHGTSLMYFKATLADPIYKEPQLGLNMYTLGEALIECNPGFFKSDSVAARTCLSLLPDVSDVLSILLEKGQTTKAGRLAGALRNIGRSKDADEIINSMRGIGYNVRENDPFNEQSPIAWSRESSPYAARLKLMWSEMRDSVISNIPKSKEDRINANTCLKSIDEQYKLDAYNSLSIEGYKVTDELIEKVKTGNWKPEENESDAQQRNAMAARGYWQTFQSVKESVRKVLNGKTPGIIVEDDHRTWFRELFAPSVNAGILKSSDLAGYRSHQVYIRDSLHTPPPPEGVRDAMPVFLELLKSEPDARVRAVLGHFIFVYIHPYMDGNGRIARFLMNTMFVTGGYNWTIIPVERRKEYMSSLEKGSVSGDISDFASFIASLMAD